MMLTHRQDRDYFESLVVAKVRCSPDNLIYFSTDPIKCNPVWFNVSGPYGGFDRDAERFKNFHAEEGTQLCLGFECPICHDLNKGLYLYWVNVIGSVPIPNISKGGRGDNYKYCWSFRPSILPSIKHRFGIQNVQTISGRLRFGLGVARAAK
jgi:hypothetical protein